MLLSYWLLIISLVFMCFAQSAFCFRGSRLLCTWWRKACPFELVVQFSFYLWCAKSFFLYLITLYFYLNMLFKTAVTFSFMWNKHLLKGIYLKFSQVKICEFCTKSLIFYSQKIGVFNKKSAEISEFYNF